MRRDIELYHTMDPERFQRERDSYQVMWKEPIEIRFGRVIDVLGGSEETPYYGKSIVSKIGNGRLFESVGLDKYLIDGKEVEAMGLSGGTLSRTNVLNVTDRVVSVEEYARLYLEMHRATVRRWGAEKMLAAGYAVDDNSQREELLGVVRGALAEIANGTKVIPGKGDPTIHAPKPLPNMSME